MCCVGQTRVDRTRVRSCFRSYTDSADVLLRWKIIRSGRRICDARISSPGDTVEPGRRAGTVARWRHTPFLALETPHLIVEDLFQDTIEDVVDNLMVLGVFESVFVQCANENELPASIGA